VKLKILHDGDPSSTKVVDAKTGEIIEGIISISIIMESFQSLATITFASNIEYDIDNLESVSEHEDTKGLHGEASSPDNREDIEQAS